MIRIDMNKAKNIAHNMRRTSREEEFKPLDDMIAKKIPDVSLEEVELERQKIRDKYKAMQEMIDSSKSVDDIKKALEE